ncbi:MAG TPA: SAM-dependent methyltransferase, partial [Cyanobacteria bacterium UBA11368]|nr:SAM-dependent methyltransferase [Cyanobacteria bacterium UBA11368]
AKQAIKLGPTNALVLDAGTGTARIPVLLCQMRKAWQVKAIDLAENMLRIGSEHVTQAGLQQRIVLECFDAKQLPYPDAEFDMVVSNSLVHHLPDPLPFFLELKRVLKPNGAVLIRDLIRPADEATMNALVASIGAEYDAHQKQLFADSLHAALTLDEVNQLVAQAGLERVRIYQSSERHWTAERSWHRV